jgi:hypothetical protein
MFNFSRSLAEVVNTSDAGKIPISGSLPGAELAFR